MNSAAIALNRFGIGARSADAAPADGRAWLLSQLGRFEPRPQAIAAVPPRREIVEQLADYIAQQRDVRQAKRQTQAAEMPAAAADRRGDGIPDSAKRFLRRGIRDDYLVMVGARLSSALTTNAPFVERLVHFWANHFAVSADKLPIVPMAGLLEFEAIRPHVLGKFSDMLLAVEQHPAMLIYLDQAQSSARIPARASSSPRVGARSAG